MSHEERVDQLYKLILAKQSKQDMEIIKELASRQDFSKIRPYSYKN